MTTKTPAQPNTVISPVLSPLHDPVLSKMFPRIDPESDRMYQLGLSKGALLGKFDEIGIFRCPEDDQKASKKSAKVQKEEMFAKETAIGTCYVFFN